SDWSSDVCSSDMHDRVAQLQVAKVRKEGFAKPCPRRRGPLLLAEDLVLGVEREERLAQAEPSRDLARHGDEGPRAPLRGDVEAVLQGEAPELLDAARGARGDQDLLAG